MKADILNQKWPLPVIIGIICAIILLAMIVHSFVRVFRPLPETVAEKSAVPAVSGQSMLRPNENAISDFGKHPFVNPVARPVSLPATVNSLSKPVPARAVFNTDFQSMQKRKKARSATFKNMRNAIRSGNTDKNIIIQKEKKLRKIQDSGNSFM